MKPRNVTLRGCRREGQMPTAVRLDVTQDGLIRSERPTPRGPVPQGRARARPPSYFTRGARADQQENTPTSQPDQLDAGPLRFIRFAAVRDRTGLSRSTIWRLERRGAFPKHRRIAVNAVGWLEEEVNEWVLARPKVG